MTPLKTILEPPQSEQDFPAIEVWENRNAHRNYLIHIKVPEFTSVCPKTGLPDFGEITIDYVPDAQVLELKAFKYYLLAYRNYGMFYENVVNKILEDIVAAIAPRYIEVKGDFTARGGINTSVMASHCAKDFDTDEIEAGFLSVES